MLVPLLWGCAGAPAAPTGGAHTGTPADAGEPRDTADAGDTGVVRVDADGDGVPLDGGDCDDTDPAVFPGAPERWGDGVDQDCDGADLTHAAACAAAAPCPDAVEIHASPEAWAGIEACSSMPGTLSWTPQSGEGPIPNTCLTDVGGDVVIEGNAGVRDLLALQRITHVGGDLKLIALPELITLEGLGALRETGEHVLLLRNERLLHLDGLSGLETIGRKLGIEDNPQLARVDALLGLALVGETLSVSGNTALCEEAIDALVAHARQTNPEVDVVRGDNGGC